jgi:predicted histidine transporter YuiF (NhaC family)
MWTAIALFIALNVLKMQSLNSLGVVKLVPFIFVAIGISAIVTTIKQAFHGGMTTELNYIKQGLFHEACDSLEKRESKKHNLNFEGLRFHPQPLIFSP